MTTKLFNFEKRDIKSFVTLLSGSVLSKLILALGTLLLAKIYGASNFGIFNAFLSIIALYPVLTSFNLENVIIKLKGSTEIRNTFNSAVLISLFSSVLLSFTLFYLYQFNSALNNQNSIFFFLCFAGGLLTSWNYIQSSLLTKYRFFKQISISILIGSFSSITAQIVFWFYFASNQMGLVYGWLFGLLSSFVYSIFISKFRLKLINIRLLKKNIKDNIGILKFAYPSDALNSIANNLLPILTIAYFSTTEVGTFALASKLIIIPLTFISSAIAKVYFQKSIRLQENSRSYLKKLTLSISKLSIIVVSIYILALNTIGAYFIDKLYSTEEWSQLNSYIFFLSPWIIARALVNPISTVLFTLNKNHFSLFFNIYLLFINLLAVYAGIYFTSFSLCVIFFSCGSAIGYLTIFFKIFLTLRKNER